MFGNQFYPNPAVYENYYCDKKGKHKHHKHHDNHRHIEEYEEHRHSENFSPRPPSPSGPFGIAPGNNLFFIILVIALVFCVRRRYPIPC